MRLPHIHGSELTRLLPDSTTRSFYTRHEVCDRELFLAPVRILEKKGINYASSREYNYQTTTKARFQVHKSKNINCTCLLANDKTIYFVYLYNDKKNVSIGKKNMKVYWRTHTKQQETVHLCYQEEMQKYILHSSSSPFENNASIMVFARENCY